jgi:hypothetical protein
VAPERKKSKDSKNVNFEKYLVAPALNKSDKVLWRNKRTLHVDKGKHHFPGLNTILVQWSTCNGHNLQERIYPNLQLESHIIYKAQVCFCIIAEVLEGYMGTPSDKLLQQHYHMHIRCCWWGGQKYALLSYFLPLITTIFEHKNALFWFTFLLKWEFPWQIF